MSFGQMVVTTKGALISAKTLQGKVLKFDHIEIGSGQLNGNEVEMEALVKKELECKIIESKIVNDKQVCLSFYFKNTDADNSFYFREIGLFVRDPDTDEEILYAYTNAGNDAEYINNSIAVSNTKTIDINVVVDNASDFTIEIVEPSPFITQDEFENYKKETDEAISKIDIKEYATKYKTITLEVEGWKLNSDTQNYEYTVIDETITNEDLIEGHMDLVNQEKLTDGYIDSYDGGYKIISSEQPAEEITMNVSIQKVITEGGE
jgi:hypothetical protein